MGSREQNEELEFFSKEGEFVEEFYNLKDFLACDKTRNTLENEHYRKFENVTEPILTDFLQNIVSREMINNSGILQNGHYGSILGEFVSLVYNHIDKEHSYDLSVFYENPELANCLIELDNLNHKNKTS